MGGRSEHLVLLSPQRHLLHQEIQLFEVRGPCRDPAEIVPVGLAVTLCEGQEGPRGRVPDTTQEIEQVSRPARHRGPGQKKNMAGADERGLRAVLNAKQFEAVHRPPAGVLDEMRLVEDHPRPFDSVEPGRLALQEIVVHDHPPWVIGRRSVMADDLDTGRGIHHQDLPFPVELERGRTDDEDYALRRRHREGDDRLPGFAQPHVVGEDRALLRDEKSNPVGLMRVE